MFPSRHRKRLPARIGIVLGIWTVVAFLLTGQSYLVVYSALEAQKDLANIEPGFTLSELFLTNLSDCAIWALLTPGIFWLARRFPFGQGKWLRSLAVHTAACPAFGFVQTVLAALAAEVIRYEIPKPTMTANVLIYYFVAKLHANMFFYGLILAVSQVLNYYGRFRDRELLSSQLEAKLAQTQLQILKMQLHPHFLFNTLHAISALIHQDVELADRMIARLGDLLRTTLENAHRQEVPFKQELDFIQPYLEIEKARLGPRLTVHLDIDPAAMDASVPNLILQPLVENAIRHGIAPRAEPGRLEIRAVRRNGFLHLAVNDDGPGLPPGSCAQGIGLANTRARLERLYGSQQQLQLANGPDGGCHVNITIPFAEISAATSGEQS